MNCGRAGGLCEGRWGLSPSSGLGAPAGVAAGLTDRLAAISPFALTFVQCNGGGQAVISLKLQKKLRRIRYAMESWFMVALVTVGSFTLGWLLAQLARH